MSEPDQPEELTPAERGLRGHLQVLRTEPLEPALSLVPRVVRKARWQRTIRAPLQAIGALAAAVGDGIRLLLVKHPGR